VPRRFQYLKINATQRNVFAMFHCANRKINSPRCRIAIHDLCADLGLELSPREDHAAYLASWLEVLKGDKRFIFTAAAHAQKACDFLHGLQPRAD